MVHLSRYMPCLCVSPSSGLNSPTLRRPHLSSPPTYRICYLLTLVHLQSARFTWRYPETGKNSTASGLSVKSITNNAVCSPGHRRRTSLLSYCSIGGNLCWYTSLPRHNHPRSGGGAVHREYLPSAKTRDDERSSPGTAVHTSGASK